MESAWGTLKRVAFRAVTTGRVKELRGFLKTFDVPDRANATANKFIGRIAADEIKKDIDETYQAIRESFGFKRKQLEASTDREGAGVIRTPKFEYSIQVQLDAENPNHVVWQREVTGLEDPELVRSAPFQQAFGTIFDTLVLEFTETIPIVDIIDQLEDEDDPNIKISCASDASSCSITPAGFRGVIHMEPQSIRVEGRISASAHNLLDQFLAFLSRFPKRPRQGLE